MMEKNERIIAISRILPGLEEFLREILANEKLSPEAEKQRLDFVKELEPLTKPPDLPPRPNIFKTQSRASVDSIDSVETDDNDFASVQRKLSNIFYLRRDFDELNDPISNGYSDDTSKGTTRKVPAKVGKKKTAGKGIYEPLPNKGPETEADLEPGILSDEEASRLNTRSLARGTHIRQSLSRGKWFAKKDKSILQEVYASDLQLPTISGHLMEVRTSKRRWCVLKDQHLYIFKNQDEPALFQIALPGCDISTVPKTDKTKVSYSFKITQDGVAAVILGIEEEKDLSAWMNALITASVSKNPFSPPGKLTKSLPRSMHTPWEDGGSDDGSSRRHTLGSNSKIAKEAFVDIDTGTYEQPTDVMGLGVSLDTKYYNPPLPPLPGEMSDMLGQNGDCQHTRPLSKYSGIYEEVGEEFIDKYAINYREVLPSDGTMNDNHDNATDVGNIVINDDEDRDVIPNDRRGCSGTSDSEYSSDDDELVDENGNNKLFHDRWAVHSGVLFQKRQTGWNRRYCKIVDNCLRGFRNPDGLTPVLELNLSASDVRTAEPEGKRRFIFQLNTAESESLYFNTDTKESLERWVEVISVAATSRFEHSVTLSEDDLDKNTEASDDQGSRDDLCGSRDDIPLPVPERVESLRKSRVITTNEDESADQKSEVEKHVLPNGKHNEVECLNVKEESAIEKSLSKVEDNFDNQEIWKKRDPHPSYATTPRAKPTRKISKSNSVKESPKTASDLDISTKSLNSPQKVLQVSKKRKFSERLKKYLDKDGQFSGFILELRVKKNSTTLTRRWAVVQNGFLRIYENYGCAAPFLRISLVEAFLKDFSNVAKARFCFMLEYGASQSILFQTNTHQELKRWINVITLTIACHADLFGSGWDLSQRERDIKNGPKSLNGTSKLKQSKSKYEVDGPEVTSPGDVFDPEMTSCNGTCVCNLDDEHVTCTPAVVRETIHRKSYSMSSSGSLDSDDIISRNGNESFAYRTSFMRKIKRRGYLRVLQTESREDVSRESYEDKLCPSDPRESREDTALQFCELKGSLFSIYDSEKSENPKQVFNLLYDKYREVSNAGLAFTLSSDRAGTVEFGCETEQNFEAWKQVIQNTALQDISCSDPPEQCEKCSSDSATARKQTSLRASFAEEEAKHHEVLRSLADDLPQCYQSSYCCYVYEVRDSSGNKTIIRRWCAVDGDLMRIFERETSREAVAELRLSAYLLKDIENPRAFPFAFKLERLSPREGEDDFLVIQASNAKDFRELLQRIKSVRSKEKIPTISKSEMNINAVKKPPLIHSKSDLSLKRIFSLARRTSKDNLVAVTDTTRAGHDTWPKVIRRERKSSRRALSDTSTDRPVTNSLIENLREKVDARNSMGFFLFDSEGRFSGYLTEVRNNTLCRSEVRKWCIIENDKFSTFDDKNSKSPSTTIDLNQDVQLVDLSVADPNTFEIRATNGQGHVFRAASDYQKWIAVLAMAIDMFQRREQIPGMEHTSQIKIAEKRRTSGKENSSQVQIPENGSIPGKSFNGKIPREATSEKVPTRRKYGRKDKPSQTQDTAF